MTEIAYWVNGNFAFSIHRHSGGGHLCGYLGVPKGHPWWGQWGPSSWENSPHHPNIHGGITFAAPEKFYWDTSDESKKRLKEWSDLPKTSRPHLLRTVWTLRPSTQPYPHEVSLGLWWVGFDCAHSFDANNYSNDGIWRDEHYVREELEGLARQAAEASRMEVLG